MDYRELILKWANEQGFQSFIQDHSSVMSNLSKWLDKNAVQQSVQTYKLTSGGLCAECGSPLWAHGVIGHDFVPPKSKSKARTKRKENNEV